MSKTDSDIPLDERDSSKNKNGSLPQENGTAGKVTPEKMKKTPKSDEEDSYKSRCKRFIRTRPHLFIIFLVSVTGFCYHFNIALTQYWEYKTTVSISNEEPTDYKFRYPSATLCFQDVVPYYKVIKKYPEYAENVERINAEMARRNNSNFWTSADTMKLINITGVQLEGVHLHKYFEEKVFRNETILQILDNYSHSHHDECILDSTPATKYGYKLHNCENVTKPVETINGEFRCFTYFMQLDLKHDGVNEFDDNFMTSLFISSKTFERRTNKV